jgi:hypothetical protein
VRLLGHGAVPKASVGRSRRSGIVLEDLGEPLSVKFWTEWYSLCSNPGFGSKGVFLRYEGQENWRTNWKRWDEEQVIAMQWLAHTKRVCRPV